MRSSASTRSTRYYLEEKYGDRLYGWLSREQKATSALIHRRFGECWYWMAVLTRYRRDEDFAIYDPLWVTFLIEAPRWRGPGQPEPQFAQRWRQMAPLGRFGRTDEVARLVLFFACDDASYITGQDIAINGGFTMAMRFESVNFQAP
ncbi:MAG: SDR family oxidoreductase [Panacagrimonas sp.]